MAQAKNTPQNGILRKLVKLLRVTFPHVVLLSSYLAYLILGSFSFCYLEGHFRQSDLETYHHQMNNTRTDIMEMLSNSKCDDNEDKHRDKLQEVNRLLDKLEEDSRRPEWKAGRMMSVRANRTWTFSSSMLFCMTTITTIGYGDIVPTSKPGIAFCVIYALIGIPFTLLLLADVGDLLARAVIWCCRKLGVHNCSRRLKTQCSRSTPSQTFKQNRRPNVRSRTENRTENEKAVTSHHNMGVMGESNSAEDHKGSGHVCTRDGSCQQGVPIFVILFILVSYICGGSWLLKMIEHWTYGEAMYFMIITFTTIGYGDLVPANLYEHDAFVFCIFFTLLGMAMMSLTIALLREKVVKSFTFIYSKLNLN